MIEIKKGDPAEFSKTVFPFAKMKLNDCFFIELCDLMKLRKAASRFAQNHKGYKFKTKEKDGKAFCQCVAAPFITSAAMPVEKKQKAVTERAATSWKTWKKRFEAMPKDDNITLTNPRDDENKYWSDLKIVVDLWHKLPQKVKNECNKKANS